MILLFNFFKVFAMVIENLAGLTQHLGSLNLHEFLCDVVICCTLLRLLTARCWTIIHSTLSTSPHTAQS